MRLNEDQEEYWRGEIALDCASRKLNRVCVCKVQLDPGAIYVQVFDDFILMNWEAKAIHDAQQLVMVSSVEG